MPSSQICISGPGPVLRGRYRNCFFNLSFDVPKAIYMQIQAPPPSLLLPRAPSQKLPPHPLRHTRVLGVTPPTPPFLLQSITKSYTFKSPCFFPSTNSCHHLSPGRQPPRHSSCLSPHHPPAAQSSFKPEKSGHTISLLKPFQWLPVTSG